MACLRTCSEIQGAVVDPAATVKAAVPLPVTPVSVRSLVESKSGLGGVGFGVHSASIDGCITQAKVLDVPQAAVGRPQAKGGDFDAAGASVVWAETGSAHWSPRTLVG
jgi:hypothetical protein